MNIDEILTQSMVNEDYLGKIARKTSSMIYSPEASARNSSTGKYSVIHTPVDNMRTPNAKLKISVNRVKVNPKAKSPTPSNQSVHKSSILTSPMNSQNKPRLRQRQNFKKQDQ